MYANRIYKNISRNPCEHKITLNVQMHTHFTGKKFNRYLHIFFYLVYSSRKFHFTNIF